MGQFHILFILVTFTVGSFGNHATTNLKYFPQTSEQEALFGYSVSSSGDYTLVGAPADNSAGKDAGAVYVFKRTGISFVEVQKITSEDGSPFDYFGYSVAIDGDNAVIGAYREDVDGFHDSGAVYHYRLSGGQFEPANVFKANPSPVQGALFGYALTLSGNSLLVAQNGTSPTVFLFNLTSPAFIAKFTEVQAVSSFGMDLALHGKDVIIGAPAGTTSNGSVFIYQPDANNTYPSTPTFTLKAPNAALKNKFGASLATSPSTSSLLVIGAPGVASAYVYSRDVSSGAWTYVQNLVSTEVGSRFGKSVAIVGDTIAVGDPLADDEGKDYDWGSVSIFVKSATNTWDLKHTVVAADRNSNSVGDNLGNAIALSAAPSASTFPTLAMPVYYSSEKSFHAGAIYFSYTQCAAGQSIWGASCAPCLCQDGNCSTGLDGKGTCLSCRAGKYGSLCNFTCACKNGVCKDGILGDGKCSSCSAGSYGDLCDACQCANNSVCDDKISGKGTCSCNSRTNWGAKCDKPCGCTNGKCSAVDGTCSECLDGFYGPTCIACECVHGTCSDDIDGSGLCSPCDSGYYGSNCSTPCPCTNSVGCTATGQCLCAATLVLSADLKSCIIPPEPVRSDLWVLLPSWAWIILILFFIFLAICLIAFVTYLYLKKKKEETYGYR